MIQKLILVTAFAVVIWWVRPGYRARAEARHRRDQAILGG